MNATIEQTPVDRTRPFPPFSLTRLLTTVFDPKPGERVCILIDLDDPREVEGFHFLQNPDLSIQRHAYDVFYQGLRHGVMHELGMEGGEMFAYQITGGSNLDLPDKGFATDGREVDLVEDVYKKYTLVLCISTYSATAPLTAFAKRYGFRGATMHGMNQIILASGLAVDYFEVSRQAEKFSPIRLRAEAISTCRRKASRPMDARSIWSRTFTKNTPSCSVSRPTRRRRR